MPQLTLNTLDGNVLTTLGGVPLLALGIGAVPVLPTFPGVTYPQVRRPNWSTQRQVAISGKRTTNALYSFPVRQWELPISVLRSALGFTEQQQLEDFFDTLLGGFACFYYDCPGDDTATDEPFGTGDGSTVAFQLQRALVPAGFAEPVQSPNGTPTIKVAGTPTTAFALGNAGVVTFTSAPANGAPLTWSGAYYWLCQFDDDHLDFSKFNFSMWELKKLSFSLHKL